MDNNQDTKNEYENAESREPHDLFDRAFKRLMHLSNPAVINFINGLFGVNHPLDSKVEYLATEHVDGKMKKTENDMTVTINANRYETEFQRSYDKDMALRIFIYAFHDAYSRKTTDEHGTAKLVFAKAAVIYLENTGKKSESLILDFQDGKEHIFTYPVFNFLEYSVADLEEKNMQMLLPFCVLRLHDKITKAKSSEERRKIEPELIGLLKDIERATDTAQKKGNLNLDDTRIIINLLNRLYKHLYKNYDELQEANKMADQFLELETDVIIRETWQKAEQATWQKAEQATWQKAEQQFSQKVAQAEQVTWQKAEQHYSQEKQAIANNMRSIGMNDEDISRVLNVHKCS